MSDSSQDLPHIIYIASVTHSGSTLVDLVLGAHSRLQSLGELKVFSRSKHAKLERVLADRCTCGASDKGSCAFWSGVESRLRETLGGGLRDLDVDSPDPEIFLAHNRALFEAAARVGGNPWIVDSSKNPRRLRRLLAAGSFDLRPIHLTRSPYGVTYSHIKKGRGTVTGALRYARTRIALDWTLARRRHAQLRYEDFVSSPSREMTRVLSWLGLPFESQQLDWTAHAHHNICGNHMRFAETPDIRLDDAWRRGLSGAQKAVIATLTGPARLLARAAMAAGPPAQSSSTSR